MHNLDRTTLEHEGHEFEHEGHEFESHEHEGHELELEGHEFEGQEFENEHEHENEQFLGNIVGGLFGEQEFENEGHEFENEFEHENEHESPFHEAEAMELAAELLTVSSEAELNHFFGKLIKSAWSGAKKFASSGVGKSLLGGLKSIAKKALPMVGSALGNMVVPGLGGAIGSKLASGAGSLLGLELEGLSAEDREFEVAKQLVNLAGAAARSAVARPVCGPPQAVARKALVNAARIYAPGLVPRLTNRTVVNGARPVTRQVVTTTTAGRPGVAPRRVITTTVGGRPVSRQVVTTTAAGRPVVTTTGNVVGYSSMGGAQGRWFRRGNSIVLVGG